MEKITVTLREGQLDRLHEHKRVTGCPVVEAIRRAIDAYLENQSKRVETTRVESR